MQIYPFTAKNERNESNTTICESIVTTRYVACYEQRNLLEQA